MADTVIDGAVLKRAADFLRALQPSARLYPLDRHEQHARELDEFRRSFYPQFHKARHREKALKFLEFNRNWFALLSGQERFRDFAERNFATRLGADELRSIADQLATDHGVGVEEGVGSLRHECARICYELSVLIEEVAKVALLVDEEAQ